MSVVHCKQQSFDVYIGRGRCPVTGKPGRWGNEFSHLRNSTAKFYVPTREDAISSYRSWLWREIQERHISLADLAALDGKVLGCWCSPKPCHGDVLLRAAAWASAQLG
jgi:hypothetical protein